jgi:hypothetical protein
LEKKARTAQRRGLDWLDRNFSPTTNPGKGGRFHYYLYGMERVGAFAEIATFNGLNWYREGARQLLKQQKGNGSWNGDPAITSFSLLFLNRASAPRSGPGGGSTAVLYGKDDPTRDVSLRAAGDSPMTIWVSSFGEKLLEDYTYEGEEKEGLRVERVEYFTEGGVILADSREGGAEWIYSTRSPKAGWAQTTFEAKGWKKGLGAFGRKDSPQLAVATEWKTPEIWLRKEFEFQPQDLIDPQLEFNFSARASGGGGVRGKLLKLYDDEEEFAGRLTDGTGVALDSFGDAQNGERFLWVTPRQSYKERIPGWGFPIRAKPEEGEYRYLQFAWRKPGNVMIQLSMDGTWGKAVRYFAGQNQVALNPAIQVTEKPPERWTVVTRDLWKDLGRDAFLTGLALTPMDDAGAEFDAFYLARSKGDFKHRRTMVNEEPEWIAVGDGGPRPAEEGAFRLFINGKEVFSGNWETGGFEPLMSAREFKNHLSPGKNVLAIHAKNSELGRALDVSLKDVKRLASISGDPTRARRGARYATRVTFPRPGKYQVWARVHVMDEVLGISVPFDSDPLHLTVTSVLDPKMLSYATDSLRNLLANGVESVVASSERDGSPATHAVDNTQQRVWLCAEGDAVPEIEVTLARPVMADLLLLSHAGTGLPSRVEVTLNGRGKPIIATLSKDRLSKTEIHLGRPQKIRSVRVRIVRHSEGQVPSLKAVGFAEVELQLGGKR